MDNYQDYLSQLPLDDYNVSLTADPSFVLYDSTNEITYLRINDTEACAVVQQECRYHEMKVFSEVSDADNKIYTVRMVVFRFETNYVKVYIPNTVCSIYGAEHIASFEHQTIRIEDDNPYFEYRGKSLFSKDGEDLIQGYLVDGNELSLDGVKTIHAIGCRYGKIASCMFPSSVKKICRLFGKFSNVTFEGVIPEFSQNALKGTEIETITVYTPKDENPARSVRALMNVPSREGFRRCEDILFASHSTTLAVPKVKGYIALTRADFEHDGDTLFVNTSWIATICPKTFRHSDVDVQGAKLLIGLHGENDNVRGVCYDVYESLEEIDEQIAYIQEQK